MGPIGRESPQAQTKLGWTEVRVRLHQSKAVDRRRRTNNRCASEAAGVSPSLLKYFMHFFNEKKNAFDFTIVYFTQTVQDLSGHT